LSAGSSVQTLDSPGYLNYTLNQTTTLYSLVAAHTAAQEAALAGLKAQASPAKDGNSTRPRFNAILVKNRMDVGLGNRIPAIVTGYMVALLSRRVFLLDSDLTQYVHVPLAGTWEKFSSHYNLSDTSTTCTFRGSMLATSNLSRLCVGRRDPLLYHFWSIDYDIPWLQISNGSAATMKRLFPKGEVFHELSKLLFRGPKPVLAEAMAPYANLSSNCLVGMQVRTARLHVQDVTVGTEAFVAQVAGIAEAIAQQATGSFFVAADSKSVIPLMVKALPAQQLLWWSNLTMDLYAAKATTVAGNPGNELSAVMDMLLLSKCKHLVLTPASSFGYVSAGLAGIHGVFATLGAHERPFFNTWYWEALTSEPCCWSMGMHHLNGSSLKVQARKRHPLFFHHNQCHW